eukprot:189459_1
MMQQIQMNQDLLFQFIGLLFVVTGSLLIYRGSTFSNMFMTSLTFVAIYSTAYQLLKSQYAQSLLEENVAKDFQNLALLIIPGLISYFTCRAIKQSFTTMMNIFRITTFAIFGYSLSSLIISQVKWDVYHVNIYTTNIPYLSGEQNVAFCVFGSLAIFYSMYQRLTYSFIAFIIVVIAISVSYFLEITELQEASDFCYTFILAHTQNVEINLKLLLPITGMISCILLGCNIFDNSIIEQGIYMIFGVLLASFGLITILSGSNNKTIIESMFSFTLIVIGMGIMRNIYIPSDKDIKRLVKRKLHAIIKAKNKRKRERKKVKQAIKQNKKNKHVKRIQSVPVVSTQQIKPKTHDTISEISRISGITEISDEMSVSSGSIQDPIEYLSARMDEDHKVCE